MNIFYKCAHGFSVLARYATTIRHVILACVVMMLSAQALRAETYVQFAQGLVAHLPADARFRPDLEEQVLQQVNVYRASKGVKALVGSDDFLVAARAQAADMMLNNFVGHRSSHGQDFQARMSAFLGNPMMLPRMAENAARDTRGGRNDQVKVQRIVNQWIDSKPHRKAMINSGYRHVSTAVVERGGRLYSVQIFWSEKSKAGGSRLLIGEPSAGPY